MYLFEKNSSIFWDTGCSDLPWPKTIGTTHATVDSRYWDQAGVYKVALGPVGFVFLAVETNFGSYSLYTKNRLFFYLIIFLWYRSSAKTSPLRPLHDYSKLSDHSSGIICGCFHPNTTKIGWLSEEEEESSTALPIAVSISSYWEALWLVSKRPYCDHSSTIKSSRISSVVSFVVKSIPRASKSVGYKRRRRNHPQQSIRTIFDFPEFDRPKQFCQNVPIVTTSVLF